MQKNEMAKTNKAASFHKLKMFDEITSNFTPDNGKESYAVPRL